VLDDYDFSRLVEECRNILRLGLQSRDAAWPDDLESGTAASDGGEL
jgi:hypothetical protein